MSLNTLQPLKPSRATQVPVFWLGDPAEYNVVNAAINVENLLIMVDEDGEEFFRAWDEVLISELVPRCKDLVLASERFPSDPKSELSNVAKALNAAIDGKYPGRAKLIRAIAQKLIQIVLTGGLADRVQAVGMGDLPF